MKTNSILHFLLWFVHVHSLKAFEETNYTLNDTRKCPQKQIFIDTLEITTNGTTESPRLTTTPLPLPTPTLPPTPEIPAVPWNVSYSNDAKNHGNFCIMAQFAAQIVITYENINKEIVKTGFDIPPNARVSNVSKCHPGVEEEILALNFASQVISHGSFASKFVRDNTTNATRLTEAWTRVPITENLFPGIHPSYLNTSLVLSAPNLSLFHTKYYHSYRCKSPTITNFTEIQVVNDTQLSRDKTIGDHFFINATLNIQDLRLQTFMLSNRTIDFFMIAQHCNGDKPDALWTVDFIVAGVMASVVALALVGYFVTKRIRQKRAEDTGEQEQLIG